MLASALKNSTTTIEVKRSTLEKLKPFRDPVLDKNWSDAIEKLLEEQGDIYVKFITIDGFLADSADHEIIFELGDDPPRYYRYKNGKFETMDNLPQLKVIEERPK